MGKIINSDYRQLLSTKWWEWYDMLKPELFAKVYAEVNDKCVRGEWRIMGNIVREPKRSIVVESHTAEIQCSDDWVEGKSINVKPHPSYDWGDLPIIQKIKVALEAQLDLEEFDYCLVNIYETGKDGINWHADNEALNSSVVSVSLGGERDFALRSKYAKTNGGRYVKEALPESDRIILKAPNATKLTLKSGDVIHMLPGCQRNMKHALLRTSKAVEPRINLTFRYYDF